METKKFKPFDKVLVRRKLSKRFVNFFGEWSCALYSHYSEEQNYHIVLIGGINRCFNDSEILPYEGNEDLVGTTEEPGEEVRLEEGELIFVDDTINDDIVLWNFSRFAQVHSSDSFETKFGNNFKYAIRFSDFHPNDMEESRKHILEVKNGKIVRYRD